MNAKGNAYIVRWLESTLLLCATLFLALHTLPRAWRTLNTDFPNYYLAARLVHEGFETSRMYEWQWIEREKDHRAIEERVIGLLPITPFSTLVMYPLTGLAPLKAKHLWIAWNIALLFPLAWVMRSLTELSYRRIAITMLLCFPLHRNLLYGQFYILLLLMIAAACLCYVRGYRVASGSLVAIAAACKVFPLLFVVLFLQRRDWKALASAIVTLVAAVALSISVFGMNAHRIWLQEILPWVMRGEGLGTYATTASFPAILHRLFLSEPQWNPHPWYDSPLVYAVLVQILPMLVLAPAILLIGIGVRRGSNLLLEWSALLTASLTVSTIPASYNFVLMIFPVCVVVRFLLDQQRYIWLGCWIAAYLVIGFPFSFPENPSGLSFLLYVPRLYCVLLVLGIIYILLWESRDRNEGLAQSNWTRYAWAAAMVASVLLGVRSTIHIEEQQRSEYAYRLPVQTQGFLNEAIEAPGGGLTRLAFTLEGYRIDQPRSDSHLPLPDENAVDQLSFVSGPAGLFVEQAATPVSQIVETSQSPHLIVNDGHDPMLSADGSTLAFLRDDHGRSRLMLRRHFQSEFEEEALTPSTMDVYEASFRSEEEYAISGTQKSGSPTIFLFHHGRKGSATELPYSRYPAISPDGRWLAYSHLQGGAWNLWLLDLSGGASHRIATLPCNQIYPSWEHDSQTLLYSTDCGRSVWFTAIARRKVLPFTAR